MFLNDQLATALIFDHQTRLRSAAARRRLVNRNKAPTRDTPPADAQTVVWSDDTSLVLTPQRAHCAA